MTDERMTLLELIEKGADADLVRELLAFAHRAADGRPEVEQLDRRRPWRAFSGPDQPPQWLPRARLGDPRRPDRAGHSENCARALILPGLFGATPDRREGRRAVIQEAYVHGVSTRSVDELVKAMGGTGISKSQVSRLCEDIDERVQQAFLSRPIEGHWPYLWIDATYLKSRQSGRIVSVAVIVAVGVNTDGRREVLGVATGASEAEVFWTGGSSARLPTAACGASSWSLPTIRRPAGRPPRRVFQRRPSSAAACIGPATLLGHAAPKQRAAVAAMVPAPSSRKTARPRR